MRKDHNTVKETVLDYVLLHVTVVAKVVATIVVAEDVKELALLPAKRDVAMVVVADAQELAQDNAQMSVLLYAQLHVVMDVGMVVNTHVTHNALLDVEKTVEVHALEVA